VVQGVQACNIGIPILADKLERVQQGQNNSLSENSSVVGG
jgi:hypothetical protein